VTSLRDYRPRVECFVEGNWCDQSLWSTMEADSENIVAGRGWGDFGRLSRR
jgi:hypothetical protein